MLEPGKYYIARRPKSTGHYEGKKISIYDIRRDVPKAGMVMHAEVVREEFDSKYKLNDLQSVAAFPIESIPMIPTDWRTLEVLDIIEVEITDRFFDLFMQPEESIL